jgi:hypothetical protein
VAPNIDESDLLRVRVSDRILRRHRGELEIFDLKAGFS